MIKSFYIRHSQEHWWREFEKLCTEDDRTVSSVLVRLVKEWVSEQRIRRQGRASAEEGRGGAIGREAGTRYEDRDVVRFAGSEEGQRPSALVEDATSGPGVVDAPDPVQVGGGQVLIETNDSIPMGEIHFADRDGQVVHKIVNLKEE